MRSVKSSPSEPIQTIYGILRHLMDVIIRAKFNIDQSRGFDLWGASEKCMFPLKAKSSLKLSNAAPLTVKPRRPTFFDFVATRRSRPPRSVSAVASHARQESQPSSDLNTIVYKTASLIPLVVWQHLTITNCTDDVL